MIISRMIAPKKEPYCPNLYFRGDGEAYGEKEIRIRPQGTVTLDTYFNALFYGAYLRYSRIREVSLRVIVSGAAELTWFVCDQEGNDTILAKKKIEGSYKEVVFEAVHLDELPPEGMLFLSVQAQTGEALLHETEYESQVETTPVKVAAVICTYHREACVLHNLAAIRRGFWSGEPELSSCLDVIICDNGNSLSVPDESQARLLPGRNCGGSGGFTRGLLAAYDSGKYSHVLFMDDDIIFETETLARTIRFLQAEKESEKPLCIGGQMLIEDRPTIQHEAGSDYVRGWLKPNGRGLDLAERDALQENARPKSSRFNAWWYCCFPVSVVDKIGLPLPLFIKSDDVEYGLRMQPDVVQLNGIGVWHMSFSEKYSPHLEYYIKRNELLVSALHGSGAGVLPAAVKLLGCCIHAFELKQHARIDFALWGYGDFLRGPSFFMKTDPVELNTKLLAKRKELETKRVPAWKQIGRIIGMLFRLMLEYRKARKAFLTGREELTSVSFWRTYLADGVQ